MEMLYHRRVFVEDLTMGWFAARAIQLTVTESCSELLAKIQTTNVGYIVEIIF